VIYLDTHVVVWLYSRDESRFAPRALELLEEHELLISPMVILELEYLYETARVTEPARAMVEYLGDRVQLRLCSRPFEEVVRRAALMKWARDPFDRMITAQASLGDTMLLTKNGEIHTHYPHAAWS
jgi:PIN domain nuclease of toxin-antitoxin system